MGIPLESIESLQLARAIEQTDGIVGDAKRVVGAIAAHPDFGNYASGWTDAPTLVKRLTGLTALEARIRIDVEKELSLEVHAADFRAALNFYRSLPRG